MAKITKRNINDHTITKERPNDPNATFEYSKKYSNKFASYDFKTGGKAPNRFINQGAAFEGNTTLEERAKDYDDWRNHNSAIPRDQQSKLRNGAHDEINQVDSSWLDTLGYDASTGQAVVTFHKSKGEFRYTMSWDNYLRWLNSPSKGKWLNRYGGKHNYTQTNSSGETFGERLGEPPPNDDDPVRIPQKNTRRQQVGEKLKYG